MLALSARKGVAMPELVLPAALVEKITTAQLPRVYEHAVAALAECDRLDECNEWADKFAALASYARQADDPELENMARRIRARAVRRMGQLLREYDGRGGDRSKNVTAPNFAPTRRQAARAAGISQTQQVTAGRVANIPLQSFNAYVESPRPPGTALLAQLGKRSHLSRSDRVSTITADFVEHMEIQHSAAHILEALLRIARETQRCDVEDVVEVLLDQKNAGHLQDVRSALGFASRLKEGLEQAFPRKADLRPV
jgi:hypothetical protein